jgi:hypothetical protein
MVDDPKIDVIVTELVRHAMIDATDPYGRSHPDENAVRQAVLYAKSRPRVYAKVVTTAMRIIIALDRLDRDSKQKELDLELDPQAKLDRIWDAVEEFSKQ